MTVKPSKRQTEGKSGREGRMFPPRPFLMSDAKCTPVINITSSCHLGLGAWGGVGWWGQQLSLPPTQEVGFGWGFSSRFQRKQVAVPGWITEVATFESKLGKGLLHNFLVWGGEPWVLRKEQTHTTSSATGERVGVLTLCSFYLTPQSKARGATDKKRICSITQCFVWWCRLSITIRPDLFASENQFQ